MKTPKNFTIRPWSSLARNSEVETIALNIMVILSRTGNTFRKLDWSEYKTEREKDGNFTDSEKSFFEQAQLYCKSQDTAELFSSSWK